ncbi:unnamed protein product [Thlaspi arvense]|uniref:Uncharacterized protein n=1 Tax=Thlaspi arvense TaxID=13288 RepID=A0AAU9SSD9_THLAR|nr:unnamed protein product [Thlaspi arvense]
MDSPSQANVRSETISDEEGIASLLLEKVIPPILLKESAGDKSCCIFRIPHTLGRANNTAYEPKIVSIGPYHRSGDDNEHLKMIEEHKKRYFEFFVSKTNENGVNLSHIVDAVSGLEQRIRDSYSENLYFDKQSLIKMMILDGCFILLLFLVVSREVEYTKFDDPIFKLRWILPTLRSDLLLLENQVPLFLLNDLLKTSKLAPSTSVNKLAFRFFNYSVKKPKAFWEKHNNLRAKHLLDLIRKTFVPIWSLPTTQGQCCINVSNGPRANSRTETPKNTRFDMKCCSKERNGAQTSSSPPPRPFLGLIVSAKKLRLRGIRFKRRENVDTPLDIGFKNGLLEIPLLVFDDFISSLLINCVAFEQFNMKCSTEITSYVTFMGCLINKEEDATFLIENGMIENYFGTGEQISSFFKNIGKEISFSISKSYLSKVFEGVNKYSAQGYHVQWAGFKYTHFNTPWTFLSSCAALILLLLTIFQAFFAAYAYFRPPN